MQNWNLNKFYQYPCHFWYAKLSFNYWPYTIEVGRSFRYYPSQCPVNSHSKDVQIEAKRRKKGLFIRRNVPILCINLIK